MGIEKNRITMYTVSIMSTKTKVMVMAGILIAIAALVLWEYRNRTTYVGPIIPEVIMQSSTVPYSPSTDTVPDHLQGKG